MNTVSTSIRHRVAIASFEMEGNTFSLKINDAAVFTPYAVAQEIWPHIDGRELAVTGAAEVLRQSGHVDLVPILVAQSQSGAKVDDVFYQDIFAQLIEGIRNAGRLDGIFLALHGAMVSGGVTDAEGDLLEAIRAITGVTIPIAVSLDLHAHVTTRMVENATIIVGYANYPHDDAYDTGRRSAFMLRDTLAGKLNPVMRAKRLKMLVPVTGSCTRLPDAPLAKIQKLSRGLEVDGVVSTSYFTAQPWLDDDDVSNVGLAITHGDASRAEETAMTIARAIWDAREAFEIPLYSADQAIDLARSAPIKPVILADQADCVGAGSSGDTAAVLEALIRKAGDLKCAVSLVDGYVAELAHASGIGAVLVTDIGFRSDARYGTPIPIRAEVLSLHNGDFTYSGGPSEGVQVTMGPSAIIRIGMVDVLVASLPTYEYAGEQYAAVGMNIEDYAIVVLKNTMNFRTLLKANSTWMLVDGVGSSSSNLGSLPWKNRSTAFWPRDRQLVDPFDI